MAKKGQSIQRLQDMRAQQTGESFEVVGAPLPDSEAENRKAQAAERLMALAQAKRKPPVAVQPVADLEPEPVRGPKKKEPKKPRKPKVVATPVTDQPKTAVEAVLEEAAAEARTLYDVFTKAEFWKKVAWQTMGETDEARLAEVQRVVDAYMLGTLSWRDIQANISPKFQKAFYSELEKARDQVAHDQQRALPEAETSPEAEAVLAEMVVDEARRTADLGELARLQSGKTAETPEAPEAPEGSKVEEGIKVQLNGLDRRLNILQSLHADGMVYGHDLQFEFGRLLDELRRARYVFKGRSRPESTNHSGVLYERITALEEKIKQINLPQSAGQQPVEAAVEQRVESAADINFGKKLDRVGEMLNELEQELNVEEPNTVLADRLVRAITTALVGAQITYTTEAGTTTVKDLEERSALYGRTIGKYAPLVHLLAAREAARASVEPQQAAPEPRPQVTPTPVPARRRRSILNKGNATPVPVDSVSAGNRAPTTPEVAPARVGTPEKTQPTEERPEEAVIVGGDEEEPMVRRYKAVPKHLLPENERMVEPPPVDLTKIAIPSQERFEKKEPGYGQRLRHGLSYLWNRGNEQLEESIAYHIRGEKTKEELGEREHTRFGIAASFTASLARTAMSFGGVAVAPDALRFMTQSHYTSFERAELRKVITEAVKERQRVDKESAGYEALQEKTSRMVERVQASRYISEADKTRLLARIREVVGTSEERREKTNEDFNRAIAKIVDDAVVNRVTGTQLTREAFNTTFALTGMHLLRAPAYAGFALVERYQQVSREASLDAGATEKVRKLVVDGFTGFAKDLTFRTGKNKRERTYNGLMAIGKVVRAGAMAYASAQGLWEYMPSQETMTAPELHERIEDGLKFFSARDSAHVMHELADHGALVPGVQTLGEHTAQEAFAHAPGVPTVTSAWERDTHLPDWVQVGRVVEGDGITQALTRVIELDPAHFGYHGPDDELSIDLFSRKLSRVMAKNDGLLNTWLTDQAKDNLIVVPVEHADGWHVGFVDAKTHEEISGAALKTFTTPKPRR